MAETMPSDSAIMYIIDDEYHTMREARKNITLMEPGIADEFGFDPDATMRSAFNPHIYRRAERFSCMLKYVIMIERTYPDPITTDRERIKVAYILMEAEILYGISFEIVDSPIMIHEIKSNAQLRACEFEMNQINIMFSNATPFQVSALLDIRRQELDAK